MSKKSLAKKKKAKKSKAGKSSAKQVTAVLDTATAEDISLESESAIAEVMEKNSSADSTESDIKTAVGTLEPSEETASESLDDTDESSDDDIALESNEEPNDSPSDESDNNEESEKSAGTESGKESAEENKPSAKRRLRIVLTVLLIIVGIILVPIASLLLYGVIPHKTEIGKDVSLPLRDVSVFNYFCEVKTDLDEIDTSVLGKHPLELEFFGFIPVNSSIVVRDSKAPRITTQTLCVPRGTEVFPEEFISQAYDMTELTYRFMHQVDTENGGTVTVRAVDECGNKTTATAELIVNDRLTHCETELGTLKAVLADRLLKFEWLSDLDFDNVDFSQCGTYRVKGKLNGASCLFNVTIVDTTAPKADVIAYDILLGQTLSPEDFTENILDRSEVTQRFETEPDFEKLGIQEISVILEDIYENATLLETKVNIHDIAASFLIEAGTSTEVFKDKLFAHMDTQSPLPRLADDIIIEQFGIGAHEITLIGEYSHIPIELIVEDTVPPMLAIKPTNVYLGTTPNANDFITSCIDASPVTFTFSETVDTSNMGEQTVTIIATDEAGNFTSMSTSMYVIKDTTKPVIYGVKPIVAYEGETVLYRNGVYASDDRDGNVAVTVNSSSVNNSVAGTYYVTYTASDSSGNTRTATTTVTIMAISRQSVDDLADQVLAKIVTDSMTDREKAHAIYNWCRQNIRYSSITSHLMGHFNKAAYTGFTKHYGNCYTYYAVASALLSRVGIENIEIHRNDPTRPHYWNLVKMDGSWYHFDTCPQPSPHRLKVFLLKDSEVRAFPLSYYYDFDASQFPPTP